MYKIINHADALSAGLTRYFTGVPCKQGHISERFVIGRKCVTCAYEYRRKPEMLAKNRARNAEWYANNRDEINARRKAIYDADPEKFRARWHVLKKKSGYLEKCFEYRKKNKSRIAERIKAYRKANPDKRRVSAQNRRARPKEGGRITKAAVQRLKVLQRGMCANCRALLADTGYHIDHIIPLALGGQNSDANIQLLCPTCNRKKSAKHPIDWAQEQGRLL